MFLLMEHLFSIKSVNLLNLLYDDICGIFGMLSIFAEFKMLGLDVLISH